ncbi:MAG: endonuclease/exonuclease/phosphatase family protein [Bacteroidetes bacterium]|nr:endonuclease/exonuclease/phosphatase family protein [Bacteroidota bacterium]
MFSLALIILGWNYLGGFIQIGKKSSSEESGTEIKIMSYNVKTFDYYNWKHNKKASKNILELIAQEDPDIICFQEYFTGSMKDFQNNETLIDEFGFKDYFFHKKTSVRGVEHFGIATFSKYPILKKGIIEYSNKTRNVSIYLDIELNGDTVRVYNIHLQSLYFDKDDYAVLDNKEDVNLHSSRRILGKLKRGYMRRAKQSIIVAKHVNECPYPVILCGDFNDTRVSFAYRTIANSKNLKDAFVDKGRGIGRTYAGPVPFVRIDFMLFGDQFDLNSYSIVKKKYSDHYPMVCSFNYNQ